MNKMRKRTSSNQKNMSTRLDHRRGSVYMLVLGTSLVLMATGLAAIMAVRVERRVTTSATDFNEARLYAQSAIEVGYQLMRDDTNWRTNRQNGKWVNKAPIGNGTYTLTVTDEKDGDLLKAPNNFIRMKGEGVKGNSKFKLIVELQVVGAGLKVVPQSWKQAVN